MVPSVISLDRNKPFNLAFLTGSDVTLLWSWHVVNGSRRIRNWRSPLAIQQGQPAKCEILCQTDRQITTTTNPNRKREKKEVLLRLLWLFLGCLLFTINIKISLVSTKNIVELFTGLLINEEQSEVSQIEISNYDHDLSHHLFRYFVISFRTINFYCHFQYSDIIHILEKYISMHIKLNYKN